MNLKPRLSFIIPIFSFILGIGLSAAYFKPKTNQKENFIETRQKGEYKLINPLLECDSANFLQDPSLFSLKKIITDHLDQAKSDSKINFASIYFRDLNNGPWFGINEKELFSPASLIKVPIMITYLKQAEKKPTLLSQQLSYSSAPTLTKQYVTPLQTLEIGSTYTIEDLIDKMIIYSDNKSYELLSSHLEPNLLIKTYNDLGIDISLGLTNPSGNIISVKDYASFFRILYNSSYLSKDFSEKSLQILTQVEYQDGLNAGIDPKITVAHKFGERTYEDTGERQLHDCGIIYLPHKPYLLCIMTRGQDFDNLTKFIQTTSRLIFTHLAKN